MGKVHNIKKLILSALFVVATIFGANGALAQDAWVNSLKNMSISGRVAVDRAASQRDEALRGRVVFMEHSVFTLDPGVLPVIKKDKGHIFIQFTKPLDDANKAELTALGVKLLQYIPVNTWKARVPRGVVPQLKALDFVYAMGDIKPVDKFPVHILEKGLSQSSINKDGTVTILVSFHKNIPFSEALEVILGLSASTEQTDYLSGHRILLTIPSDSLQSLSEFDEVNWIEDRPPPKSVNNVDAAALSNVDDIQGNPHNLTGSAIKIGEWDGGEVQYDHPDLIGRVTLVNTSSASSHATHVAGTMVGSGANNASAKGMAPSAKIYSSDYDGDVPAEKSSAASTYNITLSNNSWSYINGWRYDYYGGSKWVWFGDSNFGYYSSTSQAWDQTVIDTDLTIMASAGNDRSDDGDQAQTGHYHYGDSVTLYTDLHPTDGNYDSIGTIASSKNIIVVGAVDDAGGMTTFSSWGPVDDGRVKPDMVANGSTLTSTCPSSSYCFKSGTSMSSPTVTGTSALIVEHYMNTFGTNISPSMYRALLVGTAQDLGNTGPDYSYGWGLMNALAAVNLIDGGVDHFREGSVSNGGTVEYAINVPASTPELKVTVTWTDPSGTPGAAFPLVNDLDLELVDPSAGVHQPWVLDKDNPANAATTGVNTVDNVEQAVVSSPAAGNWTVRVKGTSIASGSQVFDVVSNIVFGAAGETNISASPMPIDYGPAPVAGSETLGLTISNTGTLDLVVGSLAISGPAAAEFSLQNDNCSSQTLAASGNCTVDVVFSPVTAGEKIARLAVPSNDPDTASLRIDLSGYGDSTVPVTTNNIPAGTYYIRQLVTLQVNEAAAIHYTTDGSTPTAASPVYTTPILIDSSLTLKYYAVDLSGNEETVHSDTYVIDRLPEWSAQIGSSTWDIPLYMSGDSDGNSYITGWTEGVFDGNPITSYWSSFLVKYDSAGNKQWSKVVTAPGEWDWISGEAVTSDSNGNVYSVIYADVGIEGYASAGLADAYVIKYDSDGNKLWAKQVGTALEDAGAGAVVDGSGNLYLSGYTKGALDGANAGGYDIFLVKFDSAGNQLWARQLGTALDDKAFDVNLDGNGNVYMSGVTKGNLDGVNAGQYDIVLVKYDSAGNHLWTKQTGTTANDYSWDIAVESSGNAYLSGATYGGLNGNTSAGGEDIILIKYDSNGNRLWTKQTGTTANDYADGVAVGSGGDVYIAGTVRAAFDGHSFAGSADTVVLKYDTNGNKVWSKLLGTYNGDYAIGVGLDRALNVYVGVDVYDSFDGNTFYGDEDVVAYRLATDDASAPAGTISINSGAAYAGSTSVILTLTCDDGTGSGCAEMQFSNDNVSWSTAEAYAASKAWTLTAGDGAKTVYVKLGDYASNWSNAYSDTITLDTAAPSTSASPAGGTYGTAQSVTLTCDDGSGSGCASTYYCTGSGCSPLTLYGGAINIAGSMDLRFFSVDTAGNAGVVSTESYMIATVPSQPTGISLSNMMSGGPTVGWNAASGATSYKVYRSPDGSGWTLIGTVSAPTTTFVDTGAKSNTFYYWTVTAENGAGESGIVSSQSGRTALKRGWNMISAPKATSGATATQVFGSWAYWSWYWNSNGNVDPDNNGSWTQSFTVEPGFSLFVWAFNDTKVLSASGAANSASVTITLVPGWNLISNQTQTNMENIKDNWLVDGGPSTLGDAITGGTIENSLYWWNGNTFESYNIMLENPLVEPWKGYYMLNRDSSDHALTIK